jgi:hypothetical protein
LYLLHDTYTRIIQQTEGKSSASPATFFSVDFIYPDTVVNYNLDKKSFEITRNCKHDINLYIVMKFKFRGSFIREWNKIDTQAKKQIVAAMVEYRKDMNFGAYRLKCETMQQIKSESANAKKKLYRHYQRSFEKTEKTDCGIEKTDCGRNIIIVVTVVLFVLCSYTHLYRVYFSLSR